MENKGLRGIATNYERVKQALGPEKVERAVEEVMRQEVAGKRQGEKKRKINREER